MWVVFGLLYPQDPEPILIFKTEIEAQRYVNILEGFKQYDSVYYTFIDIGTQTKDQQDNK